MFLSFLKSRPALKLTLAMALTTCWLDAAPYGPDGMPIEWTQPDGTKLSLRVIGDEFYGRTETLDGYTVVFDPSTKSYHYANRSKDGRNLVASGMEVGKGRPKPPGLAKGLDIDPDARSAKARARFQEWDKATGTSKRWAELKARMQAADAGAQDTGSTGGPSPAPPSSTTIGNKAGLTLLIDFSDDPATIPQAEIINYCNADSYTGYGNNGSVKKYFQDNSNGLLTYTNVVTAYVRMAQPKTYYNVTTNDCGAQGNILIKDALDILKALPNYTSEILPTFSDLTVDGSNNAVAFNVFYAGSNGGVWSKGLWPHSWSLYNVGAQTLGNGKSVFNYQITNLGTSLTLGTFCHENGHMLCGYPDIYDYDYDSVGGAGGFCLMNSGGNGTNPVLINAYLRHASGWTTTTDLTSSSNLTGTLVSTVGHADFNKIYRYAKPGTPTEYYIFENRQKTGRDTNIAASGIAIWHIDELGDHNNQSLAYNTTHANYEVTLVQADNLWHFQNNTNGGDSNDLYYLGNTAAAYTNTFSNTSSPGTKWWNGTESGLNAYNFSASGSSMTLQFGQPPNTITVLAPNGGEQLYFDSTQTISWLSNIAGNVNIELYKSGSLHTVLSANEPNDGSYSWLVSSGIPAGNDYTIRIVSVDNPAYADSSNAAFSIMALPALADALDTTDLTWTSSGNADWFAQPTTTHDGIDAAQSGAIGDSQNSYIETTITGPGTLTFWWKVSSERKYDFLSFYLDGTEQTGSLAKISGNVNWSQKTASIPTGPHTVKWAYTKDESVAANADAAWVDQVVYTPTPIPEIVVEQPLGTNLIDGSASIDCGVCDLTSSSEPVIFTVKNTGTANLTGLALSKDGTHSSDFTLGSLGATTLTPGASTTFTVTFSPGTVGARTAAIHIASNDADENPFDITLTGTGVIVGTLVVTPAENLSSSGSFGGPFSPSSISYTLSNPGITSITWTASKTAAWVDISATGGTLGPGDVATFSASINSSATTLASGSYNDTVTFTNSTNGNGDTTRNVSLAINPIPATVTLGNLSQTYDGSPKPASVTTNPPDLACSVTYDGSANPPANAGTYTVVATITEPNYSGGDSKDLLIAKATQTIDFATIDPVLDNAAPFPLTATASSGLPVSFTSSNPEVATVSGSTVTIVSLGTTTITASQPGNTNYNAASSVPQALSVVRSSPLAVTGGPYSILFGQSLSLDGGTSQAAYGHTIPDSGYQWDLNNDNTFGDVTGATPAAITYGDLTTIWGMTPGPNTIQLKVTDSAGNTSITSTTLTLTDTLGWDASTSTGGAQDGAGTWIGSSWWTGSGNVTWAPGSNAGFGHGGIGGTVTLASPTTVNAIIFDSFTGTYTLGSSGQPLTLNGGITNNSATGAVSIISPVALGDGQSWSNHSSGALTASGAISGSGGLTKSGAGTVILDPSPDNSDYSGTTIVSNGVLNIQKASALGSISDGTSVTSGAALQIQGGITVSEETLTLDGGGVAGSGALRNISGNNIYGGLVTLAGATRIHSDSDTLTLDNSGTIIGAGLPLTFGGAGNVTVKSIISTDIVTKEGEGTLILAGANTYTGPTTVSAGKLFINGNQASATGAVSISANATLGGTGVIGGDTTIDTDGRLEFDLSTNDTSHEALELASGKTFTFSGASILTITSSAGASSGNYTLISAPGGMSGNAPSTLVLPDGWTGSVAKVGNQLILNVTLPDTIAPTLISITDDKDGGPIAVNTLTTYTVTFSEDMDASTVTADDFGNAGTATVTIGTVSETSPGVFTVEVTPDTAGTLHLQINAGSELKDVAGNNLNTAAAIPDDNVITVNITDPFAIWSGGAAFDADANGDGLDNGLAWLLGAAAPNVSAFDKLPVASSNDGNLRLAFRCLNSAKRGGAALKVQFSSDLGASDSWTSQEAAVPDVDGSVNGVVFDTTADGDFINVIADIPAGTNLFGRLKAEQP